MSRIIELTQGHFTIVDDEDYQALSAHKWYYYAGYARRSIYKNGKKGGSVRMHRVITNCPAGMQVDHINGNTLDNRRSNLRVCTQSENQRNQKADRTAAKYSRYKGVSKAWVGKRKDGSTGHSSKPWRSYIFLDGRYKSLGYYATEVEAALAYDDAAREHFGAFARTNFPLNNKESQ